jgi:hypothetical protein
VIKKIILFSLLILSSQIAFADLAIKEKLESEVTNFYLKKLEVKFGDCGATPSSCISKREDYMVASLPKDEVCLPYTMCGFYHCMENKYHCSDVGVNYFTELAFPTCSEYTKNIKQNQFSRVGVEWIYSVMVCLQKGLIDECEINGNCQQKTPKKICEHITDFTLAYHPGCYIKSGVGVCHLPMKDKLAIWKTVSPYMTKKERKEAYKVVFHCLLPIKKY